MTDRSIGPRYAPYALAVLMVAYVLAFVDRQVLNLLVEPIKHDLKLSDTGISLLQGLSFALFLSIGGLPIGRLVDTRRRVTVLSMGIAFWSIATGCFGLTRIYAVMLLSRIGVGVGEATMTPSAYSLLGDYFPPRRLGLAVGIYSMGAFIGSGLAMILGGAMLGMLPKGDVSLPLVGAVRNWQAIFLLLVPIGLGVALWVASLREPRRGAGGSDETPGWGEVRRYFAAHWRPILGVDAAVGFTNMAAYGLLSWTPAMMARTFQMGPAAAGWRLGWIVILACSAGTFAAGLAGDALRSRGRETGRLMVMAGALAAAIPLAIAAPLMPAPGLFLALTAALLFCLSAALGSGPATVQEITPGRMRGVQHAIAVLTANLLGLGLGPTIVALITDRVFARPAAIAWSLAIALPLMLLIALGCCAFAMKVYASALRRQQIP